jgi:hypothetical protein
MKDSLPAHTTGKECRAVWKSNVRNVNSESKNSALSADHSANRRVYALVNGILFSEKQDSLLLGDSTLGPYLLDAVEGSCDRVSYKIVPDSRRQSGVSILDE